MSAQNPDACPESLSGTCHVLFAFDIAYAIDLDRAEALVATPPSQRAGDEGDGARVDTVGRAILSHSRKAPPHFEYRPSPLRAGQRGERVDLDGFVTDPVADCTFFDFGGCRSRTASRSKRRSSPCET